MERTENPAALAGAHRAGKTTQLDSASSFTTEPDVFQAKTPHSARVAGFRSVGDVLHSMGFACDQAGVV